MDDSIHMDSGAQLFRAVALDGAIEDARNKKKTLDANVQSIINLRKEVERYEKAAEEAKKEADKCSLNLGAKMEELKLMEQHATETNEMHAKEVYAQKAALATEMEDLQFRAWGMLDEGDESLATLDKIRYSLEKRLASTIIKKEAADKEKLEKEVAFAYQKIQLKKVLEESKRLQQEEVENIKVREFLIDRRHVVNKLQKEISCKCSDVNLLKIELEDYQKTSELLRPITQETTHSQECKERLLKAELEDYDEDATEVLEPIIQETEYGPNDRVRVRYKIKADTSFKSFQKHHKKKATRKLNEEMITEAVKEYEEHGCDALHGIPYTSYKMK
ncbi:hypothetical protein CTI12_AA119790 [Artemisia annua]|uniref:Uncharacterized protein n=1 Tax=Artemisia annua TaxID=35608 RepID=A0A2U1PRY2_ARTAN|nr:hypothetical protein CTI12_AA119790 [Artemisia annua]